MSETTFAFEISTPDDTLSVLICFIAEMLVTNILAQGITLRPNTSGKGDPTRVNEMKGVKLQKTSNLETSSVIQISFRLIVVIFFPLE